MDFQNLEEIYSHMETIEFSLGHYRDFTHDLKKYEAKYATEEIRKIIKLECIVFDFSLKEGRIEPFYANTLKDGKTVFQYPSLNEISQDELEYLIKRSNCVKNPHLVIRYNQILWNSSQKHLKQLKKAVDSYKSILSSIDIQNQEFKFIETLTNGCSLASLGKYCIDDFKSYITNYIHSTLGSISLKNQLINFCFGVQSIKKDDIFSYLPFIIKSIKNLKKRKKSDLYLLKSLCETGLMISQKCSLNQKLWNKRLGDTMLDIANSRLDDTSKTIPLTYYWESIKYFKKANNVKKIKKAETLYFNLKKSLKLESFRVPLKPEEVSEWNDHLNSRKDYILSISSDEIYDYLTLGYEVFPNLKFITKMSSTSFNPFEELSHTTYFDTNNNIYNPRDKGKIKYSSKTYTSYMMHLKICGMPLLHKIFIEGQLIGKINFQTLIEYLNSKTWLGQEMVLHKNSQEETITFKWISMLAPALYEYFLQTESLLKSNTHYSNYIMPIDSLVLKFEGILRDFARLIGVSTTKIERNDILREKYIEELLAEKEVAKYFDESDLLFFNVLFLDKNGFNLRNNIAHCFYRFENYNFQYIHLLICAFLRIGKYRMDTSIE